MKQPQLNAEGDPYAPIGLIEIGSMFCGLGTVIAAIYIIAVCYGVLP